MNVKVSQCNQGLPQVIIDLEVEMKLKFADFNLVAPSKSRAQFAL